MRGAALTVVASAGPANKQGFAMQEPWGATTAGNALLQDITDMESTGGRGSFTGFLGGLYRPQLRPARPTTQNKIGWLGAVAVSGLNGSPDASVPVEEQKVAGLE